MISCRVHNVVSVEVEAPVQLTTFANFDGSLTPVWSSALFVTTTDAPLLQITLFSNKPLTIGKPADTD